MLGVSVDMLLHIAEHAPEELVHHCLVRVVVIVIVLLHFLNLKFRKLYFK